ncbi:hypothetical protein BDN71DRAFT_1541395 [Pleurotus eryngii]|uniref:Uncharacterized protein n=1 Tax=Pleurotus eryngii TaxID=5323 RepID=A0A9P6A5K2_PLEER|nr:hypothetical protein BDN71DRAFT_1541395 [Pleurotus eryngii]
MAAKSFVLGSISVEVYWALLQSWPKLCPKGVATLGANQVTLPSIFRKPLKGGGWHNPKQGLSPKGNEASSQFEGDFFGNNYNDRDFPIRVPDSPSFSGSINESCSQINEDEDLDVYDHKSEDEVGLDILLEDVAQLGHVGEPMVGSDENSKYGTYQDNVFGATAQNPWAPFTSKVDWEVARWAKLQGSGSTAFSDLLGVENALFEDSEHLAYLCFSLERHYTDADKTERLYHEMNMDKWWWSTQEALEATKLGATIIPIIVSSDKTQLALFWDKTTYPVYLTIGNLPKSICCKPSCCS